MHLYDNTKMILMMILLFHTNVHVRVATNLTPVKPCHLLTAKRRLAVTVMMAGDVRPGWVLAATWVTGELDGNFSTMMTSCCICSVNISGVCRRRYCSGHPGMDKRDVGKREGKRAGIRSGGRRAKRKKTSGEATVSVSEERTEGEGGKRSKEKVRKLEQDSSY